MKRITEITRWQQQYKRDGDDVCLQVKEPLVLFLYLMSLYNYCPYTIQKNNIGTRFVIQQTNVENIKIVFGSARYILILY